jgi:hypothetical protein
MAICIIQTIERRRKRARQSAKAKAGNVPESLAAPPAMTGPVDRPVSPPPSSFGGFEPKSNRLGFFFAFYKAGYKADRAIS